MNMTREEVESKHKKALKALDGERRAAVKKAKALKGKKGKEALAAVEEEYDGKQKALQATLEQELAGLSLDGDEGVAESNASPDNNGEGGKGTPTEATTTTTTTITATNGDGDGDDDAAARERKLAKARKKREKQREREAEKERQIAEETANAGPSMRDVELDQLQNILTPLSLAISPVPADGHCMYRSIAAQLSLLSPEEGEQGYNTIREVCANTLRAHEDEFSPFCEYDDEVTNFDQYVDKVRDSAEWGGHLELRALRIALDRPILIYSVSNGREPLEIHSESETSDKSDTDKKEPIRLSYHLHYYALGEHYNQVVKLA
mmetsp:Transcript_15244/g.37619  ORF Transcript_15244/g.37619 Transcript_15244/m.37619 type:complete len:321 (-) Transcript_15244:437-1399(-)